MGTSSRARAVLVREGLFKIEIVSASRYLDDDPGPEY